MEALTSFSSRRPAAGALPAFSLPPPNSDVPRSSADGLSPSLSSVHTTSSQASHSNMQYTYGSSTQGAWNSSSTSPYANGSQTGHQQGAASGQNPFGPRTTGMYSQTPNMGFQRNSQSPATGAEGLPAPPMDQVHSSYQVGQDSHGNMSSGAPSHSGVLSPSHPQTPSGHMDYAYSRPPSNTSYYTASSAHPSQGFSSYPPQQSPSLPSPGGHDSRGSLSGQPMSGSYRYQYQPGVANMGGPVMSNMHQPGGQMSMIPGMVPQNYGSHMMYGHHGQSQPQSERPFKCDQCVQSFSRNHDLKRHKRIHLAVKPFPCTFCSKSFSRKDALKRHRLVKGCEAKAGDGEDGVDRNGGSDRPSV